MFENIHSIVINAFALALTALIFLPGKSIRWGWLWFTQILFTEWLTLTFVLSLALAYLNLSTSWFILVVLYALYARQAEIKKHNLQSPADNLLQRVCLLLSRNIFPFSIPPRCKVISTASGNDHLHFAKKDYKNVCFIIHGGAWMHGDASQLTQIVRLFHQQQTEVISLNYKKFPNLLLPQIIESVEKDFLELASRYPNHKITVYGRSAGGHLSLMLAAKYPEKISHVVSLYPVTDLAHLHATSTDSDILKTKSWLNNVMGGSLADKKDSYHQVSPASYSYPRSVPTFLVHGENDPVVAVDQSDLFFEKNKDAKITYLKLSHGTHGFDALYNGMTMTVFKKHLKTFLNEK